MQIFFENLPKVFGADRLRNRNMAFPIDFADRPYCCKDDRVRCDTAFICCETESEVSDTSQPTSAVTSTGNESRHVGGASSHYTADTVWIE